MREMAGFALAILGLSIAVVSGIGVPVGTADLAHRETQPTLAQVASTETPAVR